MCTSSDGCSGGCPNCPSADAGDGPPVSVHINTQRPRPKSRVIGQVSLDPVKAAAESELLLTFPWLSSYSEYADGRWASLMLANKTGDENDGMSHEYEGAAKVTPLGLRVPYLLSVIQGYFLWPLIKSVRVFLAVKGGIVAHTDYNEFSNGFNRVHIPIKTNESCINSEGPFAYHMEPGQVVFLDGREPHAATNDSDKERMHLVIDFCPNVALRDVFSDLANYTDSKPLTLVNRPTMPAARRAQLAGLGLVMNHANYGHILGVLNREHFKYDLPAQATYRLLLEAAEKSGDISLVRRAMETEAYFIPPFSVSA